jgi:type III restriction enzyme
MPLLTQGKVLVTNWHVFEPQTVQVGGVSAKVNKSGVAVKTTQTIRIGPKTTSARGSRYLTQEEFDRQVAARMLTVKAGTEKREADGSLKSVQVESERHV